MLARPRGRRRQIGMTLVVFAGAVVLAFTLWLLHSIANTSDANHGKVTALQSKVDGLDARAAELNAAITDVRALLGTISVHDAASAAALARAQADLQRLLGQGEPTPAPGPTTTETARPRPGPTVTRTVRPSPSPTCLLHPVRKCP